MIPSHVMEKTYNILLKEDGNFCSPIIAIGKTAETKSVNHIFPAPIDAKT
ncbi:MAG: hypothetical protein H5T36_01100 [Methanobacteriaceae archaeon]|nr:hypothetical protein [Methanobacteriaceae archaeon]